MQPRTLRPEPTSRPTPLPALVELAHRARHTASVAELEFLLVNGTHQLTPYRQAALWSAQAGVQSLSGVVQPETHAPYTLWLAALSSHLLAHPPAGGLIDRATVPPVLADEWHTYLPEHALWLPLSDHTGGLLLARELPWQPQDALLLTEWLDIWHHAWRALIAPQPRAFDAVRAAWRRWFHPPAPRAWWHHPPLRYGALIVAVALMPVRLSVLSPGELVSAQPAVVRAPLEGVIAQFHVSPNQAVIKDAPLFDLDKALIATRLEMARQALLTAETEHRQTAQQALFDARVKNQLATLAGKIEERRAEVALFEDQLNRAQVVAPREGVVLMDDPQEWIGRPVSVGERILRVAAPHDIEIEAWLPVADAIAFDSDAPVTLYLNASPLSPVSARLRYLAHDASPRPDGSYAYRLRATLDAPTAHRVGLKGTAKVAGGWVPLCYWVLRRPWATLRATLGW